MNQYIKITEFMGRLLGRDYEIVLHDLLDKDHSIVAIANNFISGRQVGGPLTNVALQIISDKSYMTQDYRTHYSGVSRDGKRLASSTLFIKNSSRELIGLLCVNFDGSRYVELSEKLAVLRYVDPYIDSNFQFDESMADPGRLPAGESLLPGGDDSVETFYNTTDDVTKEAAQKAMEDLGVVSGRLSPDERLAVVEKMHSRGAFLLKGAVRDTADALDCSPATIYRYLAELRERNGEDGFR